MKANMRAKRGHCFLAMPFKLRVSNLDQNRRDVLQIMGRNVTAGQWEEIPENTFIEIPILDAQMMIAHYLEGTLCYQLPDTFSIAA